MTVVVVWGTFPARVVLDDQVTYVAGEALAEHLRKPRDVAPTSTALAQVGLIFGFTFDTSGPRRPAEPVRVPEPVEEPKPAALETAPPPEAPPPPTQLDD